MSPRATIRRRRRLAATAQRPNPWLDQWRTTTLEQRARPPADWREQTAAVPPPAPRRSRPGATTLAQLVPLTAVLPISLACTWLLVLVPARVTPVPWWLYVLGYLATGLVMFMPPCQGWVARRVLHLRRPDDHERERLATCWAEVTRAAGIPPDRFVLRVEASDDVNAFAASSRVVAVTTTALDELDDAQLTGVLAHELGHHLGCHTVVSWARWWLRRPITAVQLIAWVTVWVLGGLIGLFRRWPPIYGLLLPFYGIRVISRALALVLGLIAFPVRWLGRAEEYAADQLAFDLGFGVPLISAFEHTLGDGEGQLDLGNILFDSHPPMARRIARLEAQLPPGWRWHHSRGQ